MYNPGEKKTQDRNEQQKLWRQIWLWNIGSTFLLLLFLVVNISLGGSEGDSSLAWPGLTDWFQAFFLLLFSPLNFKINKLWKCCKIWSTQITKENRKKAKIDGCFGQEKWWLLTVLYLLHGMAAFVTRRKINLGRKLLCTYVGKKERNNRRGPYFLNDPIFWMVVTIFLFSPCCFCRCCCCQ